jgi:phosphotransferase system HPr-like phosphotransfer protein
VLAGKSIMGVMCLARRKGEEITLIADGIEEQQETAFEISEQQLRKEVNKALVKLNSLLKNL